LLCGDVIRHSDLTPVQSFANLCEHNVGLSQDDIPDKHARSDPGLPRHRFGTQSNAFGMDIAPPPYGADRLFGLPVAIVCTKVPKNWEEE